MASLSLSGLTQVCEPYILMFNPFLWWSLVQDCINSIANALELLQSCIKPLNHVKDPNLFFAEPANALALNNIHYYGIGYPWFHGPFVNHIASFKTGCCCVCENTPAYQLLLMLVTEWPMLRQNHLYENVLSTSQNVFIRWCWWI